MAQQLRKLRLLPALLAVTLVIAIAPCFVAPPKREVPVPPLAAGLVALAAPLEAAYAKLPPLEDVPLEDIGATRQGKLGEESDTFFGISFQVWIFVILGAVTWAATWVLNLKPAKDAEGTYKTYIGAGALPPDGFTNPADPRVQEELTDEDDDLYSDELRPGQAKGAKAASSAIV
mmetsp:Transcript_22988/g.37418  ORF Transcript_22988/g.37418 Transcript_22988/m.37418 type:complete len:175 (-) Transcript_22988:201-725(-)